MLSIFPKQLLSPHGRTVAPHQLLRLVWAQRGPVRALNTVTVTSAVTSQNLARLQRRAGVVALGLPRRA